MQVLAEIMVLCTWSSSGISVSRAQQLAATLTSSAHCDCTGTLRDTGTNLAVRANAVAVSIVCPTRSCTCKWFPCMFKCVTLEWCGLSQGKHHTTACNQAKWRRPLSRFHPTSRVKYTIAWKNACCALLLCDAQNVVQLFCWYSCCV